eukprot:CAMPEP_0114588948 /NCGR_PEP_ID=MMETSP0125-20121206/11536_1 /TAXON_ID=485358 ORGANISM="Aristerostoma sp., Strain ATCC 50986" /NCGR_SAMPLE_ID=MMETSP0125 /ASSEMBLY_ACC=CAM_ASM_000245 /LENGTH=55 /DNA_ID=CAMNT_0001785625 /DNA_START=56 /DNA_END=223 /DNA_ORIENTATION=-
MDDDLFGGEGADNSQNQGQQEDFFGGGDQNSNQGGQSNQSPNVSQNISQAYQMPQ